MDPMGYWSRAEVLSVITIGLILLVTLVWILRGILRDLRGPVLPERDEHEDAGIG